MERYVNGSRFQDAIARHYQLQKWVDKLPRVNDRSPTSLAGLFESWLAAVYISEQSWEVRSKSTIQTIRDWYTQILKIRLRDLFQYISQPCISIKDTGYENETDSDNTTINLSEREINTKNTELLLENVKDRENQFIGYEISVKDKRGREKLRYFNTDRYQSEDRVRTLMQSQSVNPMTPDVIQVSPHVVRHQESPLNTSDTLFAKYHQMIFDHNISLVSSSTSQDSLVKNMIKLSSEYKSWLDLISSTRANLKTRALLSWNLVPHPLSFFIFF